MAEEVIDRRLIMGSPEWKAWVLEMFSAKTESDSELPVQEHGASRTSLTRSAILVARFLERMKRA